MNHIARLTAEREDALRDAKEMRERIWEFQAHLALAKYTAPATDGSRTDWIATADVNRWLTYITNG